LISGHLDRRLELRHRTTALDPASGQTVESWPAEYDTVWARKLDSRSREYLAAKQINADLTTVFRIRFRTDVLASDQGICEGVTYTFLPPTEIGRREWLDIVATAVRP
jgi:SPP1 family predicted phage head-tail adaptor